LRCTGEGTLLSKNLARLLALLTILFAFLKEFILRFRLVSLSTQKAGATPGHSRVRAAPLVKEWWVIILTVPSLYLLCTFPPLWKDIDAFWQLAAKADAVNILQYPPVYCFLSRIPFGLASGLEGHGFHHNLLSKQIPTDLGLYILVVLQHVALITSMAYAVRTIAGPSRTSRIVCAVIFASMGGLYAQAQTCGSESWNTIAVIAVFTSGVSLIKHPRRSAWVIYGIGLFFAVGSRHLNMLLVAWLPFVMVVLGLVDRWRNSFERRWWRSTIMACSLGLLVIGLNSIIARGLMACIGERYRPTIGRTLSDRVSSFLKELSPDERRGLADNLAREQTDPLVRQAIQLQATIGLGPEGTGEAVATDLRKSGVSDREALEKSDRLVLAESLVYLRTLHPVLIHVIFADIWMGLSTNQQVIALSPFYSHLWAAEDMVRRPHPWSFLVHFSRLKVDDAKAVYARAMSDPYLGLWRHVPFWLSYVTIFCLGIACLFLRRASYPDVVIICSTLLVGLSMWTANMICVYYMDRYTLCLLISSVVGFAVVASRIAQDLSERRVERIGKVVKGRGSVQPS